MVSGGSREKYEFLKCGSGTSRTQVPSFLSERTLTHQSNCTLRFHCVAGDSCGPTVVSLQIQLQRIPAGNSAPGESSDGA
eukprot:COSAG02_NODE_3085_length_7396_cov_7.466082_4_plen_80_part_00